MFGKPPPKVCELVRESVQTRVFLCHRLTKYKRNEPQKKEDNSKQKQKRKNKPLASPTYDGSFVPFLPQRSATTNSMWNTRNRRRHLLRLSFYFFVFVGSAIRYMSSCIIIAVHHNLKTKQNRRRAEKGSRRSAHTIALEFGILFARATGEKKYYFYYARTPPISGRNSRIPCDNHCFGCVRAMPFHFWVRFLQAKNAENSGRQPNVEVDVYDDVLPPRAR